MSLLPVGFGASGDDYTIDDSLRFRRSATAYLSRTPASAGNRRTWTWSGWVKRGALGTDRVIGVGGTGNQGYIGFVSESLYGIDYNGSTVYWNLITNAVFRDPSAWYHIIIVLDTTEGTSSNRVKYYVNGVQQTSFATASYPSLNYQGYYNDGNAQYIGRRGYDTAATFDGYLTEVNFIDGQALTPTDFGEFDDNGTWKPLAYTGTYGTNGFYLNATTSGTTVLDQSGNSNNWSSNNMNLTTSTATTYDLMKDTPSLVDVNAGNFATLNPLQDSGTLSNANLRMTGTFDNYRGRKGTMQIPSSGKWYWEYNITVQNTGSGNWTVVGVCLNDKSLTGYPAGTGYIGYGERNDGRNINNEGTQVTASSNIDFSTGDVLQVAYDVDTGKFWFGRNNTWFDSSAGSTGNPSTGANATLTAAAKNWHPFLSHFTNNNTTDINFGQRPFAYTPPTGFLKLNTFNLPDSTIGDGSDYFTPVLYTGNGATNHNITGVGFQPDWVWLKERSSTSFHQVLDAVRGAGIRLETNSTGVETTPSPVGLSSFDSDGFTVENNNGYNQSSQTYVAWNWKANGSGVSNNVGSIPSTVSVNTTAGFSIVSWSGNSTNGATIGHGIGTAPNIILTKCRSHATSWIFGIGGMSGFGVNDYFNFQTTGAKLSSTTFYQGYSANTFQVGVSAADEMNKTGRTYISYVFSEVPGYSSFGSYTGNGSADGPFIYTGFRPAFVIIKKATGSVNANAGWILKDATRDIDNVVNANLQAESAGAEYTSGSEDFLSNGFKIRTNNIGQNTSGSTYIYMAFAENPFKNALAR